MLAAEPLIRIGCFAGMFAAMALAEQLAPRRDPGVPRGERWPGNLGIVALNTVAARTLLPTTAVGLAEACASAGTGLFNQAPVPGWLAGVASLVLLDLAIYLQHVVFHRVPLLWRLHRMHHADVAFDVTTGSRFHTLEILLSLLIKFAVIAGLGAPAIAVLVFEVLLSATALFNHANVKLPPRFDGLLRWVVVTPDMHRVHHSIHAHETNSNFGFNLPWWDRLFGTYRAEPQDGHEAMTIGLERFREPEERRLDHMLTQPFR